MPTFVQTYLTHQSAALTWTENGGVFPTPYDSQVKVFQNGQLLISSSQYVISGSTITIDASVHFSGANYAVYAEVVALTVTGSGLSCLDTIVGLDRTPCDCFKDDRPGDYNQSDSGYYLTDPEYGVPMQNGILASADCGEGSIWDVLRNARTMAINDFQVDIKAALDNQKKSSFEPWNGVIGKPSANRNRTINQAYAGRVIKPKGRRRHQKLVITALYLGIDFTGNVDVFLNSNAFGFTRLTETISAVSGQFVKHTLSTPWEIDLYQAEIPDLYYTVSYATGGNPIQSNKIWCCSAPSWMRSITDFGFSDNSETSDFSEVSGSNTEANGLAYECYTYCDDMAWICELDKLGGKQMKSLLGRAVQHKATVKILSQMLEAGKINQYTLMSADHGFQKMAHAQDLYNNIITWIAQQMPNGYSGCFACNQDTMEVVEMYV